LRRGVVIVLALACLAAPAVARADGDPASDYLISRDVFLPYNAKIDADTRGRLDTVVRDAAERKFRIRVALIAQPYDLGSVFQLYGKPQKYAQFLGQELAFAYGGRLLVAMPNGYGYAEGGKPNPRLAKALAGLPPPGRDPTKLAAGATTAVRRLAAAAGKPLPPPETGDGSSSETRDRVVIAAAAAIGVALVVGLAMLRRLRVQRREPA
jgi:hypothetical protein